jgi:hypothetical protein
MPSSADRNERRRRRELLRAHHPDLGGDAAEFIRAVAATRAGGSPAAPATPADEVRFVRRARGLDRLRAWHRALERRRHRRDHPRVI